MTGNWAWKTAAHEFLVQDKRTGRIGVLRDLSNIERVGEDSGILNHHPRRQRSTEHVAKATWSDSSLLALKRRARKINRLLGELYPYAVAELDFTNAFELLIATVLSAQTTDIRVNAVTPVLFARYPDAKAMAEADEAELQELIRPTGFFRAKAASIKALSTRLVDEYDGEVPGQAGGPRHAAGRRAGKRPTWCWAMRSEFPASPWTRTLAGCPAGSAGPRQGPGEGRGGRGRAL